LVTSLRNHSKITSFKKYEDVIYIYIYIVNVDGFLQNGGNSSQKKFSYITNIYFKFSKKMYKVYNDIKD
jgi:hypothetical protein